MTEGKVKRFMNDMIAEFIVESSGKICFYAVGKALAVSFLTKIW